MSGSELFIELFSEEIPARMQRNAAADLERLVVSALGGLSPANLTTWFGPRRIALRAQVAPEIAAASTTERGPRANAPEQALTGFLRKHNATRDQIRQQGDYWILEKTAASVSAAELIASVMPGLLRRFPWPKSMRWGGTSTFVWVRPLRRITCLLAGQIIPFDLRDGPDDGHGLLSSNQTEGHRFHAPEPFDITSASDWRDKLVARRVIVDAADRKRVIADRIAGLAAEKHLTVVDDPGLLDEVAGLVEWPVPHLGRISDEHMDLPPEVMQVSMRVNQRYFSLRAADGSAAPWFAFVANIEADDHGHAIIAGNERVLRARFADARHFWDLDRRTRLQNRIPALENVTFQARLGSQGERVRRIIRLATAIAPQVGADPAQAARAAELAKADLVTGMVGEFPELQGVMGRYYALHDGEAAAVADAVRDHYAPRGPAEAAPSAPVSIAVALADKLDQLTGFFAIGERPTGSGDPYALRRAALGVIRIIRENGLRVHLRRFLAEAASEESTVQGVFDFVIDRLTVQLRADGARYDVLKAVFGAGQSERHARQAVLSGTVPIRQNDDLVDLLALTGAVADFLLTPDGADLLAAYRRAANILSIEERRNVVEAPGDGAFVDPPDPDFYKEPAEVDLHHALTACHGVARLLEDEAYGLAMTTLAGLRAPLDAFFEKVTVNASDPDLRGNRLRLLNQVRSIMDQIADFSRIEG